MHACKIPTVAFMQPAFDQATVKRIYQLVREDCLVPNSHILPKSLNYIGTHPKYLRTLRVP